MRSKAKNLGGRPRAEIKWEEFDKLCAFQCTQKEIAEWFACSVDTIERAVLRDHKVGFAEYFAQKSVKGRVSLRRAQFQAAIDGNVTAMIWLGKNWLGQTDKQDITSGGQPLYKTLQGVSLDDL